MPIGQSNQLRHVLATQTLWQKKPRQMRITIDGKPGAHVTAKDIVLAIIARIGIGGAAGHAVEYCGSTIRAMSIEARLTICNMSIEAGARIGMIAPDDTTYDYLHGRPYAPQRCGLGPARSNTGAPCRRMATHASTANSRSTPPRWRRW